MKQIIFITLCLAFFSCERMKEVSLDYPYEEDIVIYGFLGNEKGNTIKVYNNDRVDAEIPNYEISEGICLLIKDNEIEDTLSYDGKHYYSEYFIEEGPSYNVEIELDQRKFVSDTVRMLKKNKILDFGHSIDSLQNTFYVDILFQDSIKEEILVKLRTDNPLVAEVDKGIITFGSNTLRVSGQYYYSKYDENQMFIGREPLRNVEVYIESISEEKRLFDESRLVIGTLGTETNYFSPIWGNIDGALGYIATYHRDSVYINF